MIRLAMLLVFGYSVAWCQVRDFAETDFHRADSIAERYEAHPLFDLQILAYKLTAGLRTEQEKFRAIYKWVCDNIEADYELVQESKRGRARLQGQELNRWNKEFNQRVFNTLRYERKTTCTGYSYVVRELAMHAGLPCVIVNGHARHTGVSAEGPRPINHSWNEVQLSGKWYLCDATWSSGIFNVRDGMFVKKYNDLYFLAEPALFFQTHQKTDSLKF